MHFIADHNFLRYLHGRIEFVSRVFRAVYVSGFSSRLPSFFFFLLLDKVKRVKNLSAAVA